MFPNVSKWRFLHHSHAWRLPLSLLHWPLQSELSSNRFRLFAQRVCSQRWAVHSQGTDAIARPSGADGLYKTCVPSFLDKRLWLLPPSLRFFVSLCSRMEFTRAKLKRRQLYCLH